MERKKDGFDGQRAIVLPQTIKEILNTNELTSLLYITDIGFYPNANGHYRIRKEGAEQHILIYCTDGKGWISTKGEKHNLSKGEFFIIEAGTPHSYGASEKEPWSIYWLHFTGEKSHLFKSIYNITQTDHDIRCYVFDSREFDKNDDIKYGIQDMYDDCKKRKIKCFAIGTWGDSVEKEKDSIIESIEKMNVRCAIFELKEEGVVKKVMKFLFDRLVY